jgi:lipoate-protein ligase A
LLNTLPADGRCLLLWTARDAVVLGKNQNPWLECNLEYMEQAGIRLARRISGGGTVFHDTGNLNYSFIVPRWSYADGCIYSLVIDALAQVDIDAECSGKAGLTVGGKKIGGTAYCYRKDLVLHHGTLLVSADLDKLNQSLVPQVAGINSHSIRSKPADVVNLDCDMSALEQALLQQAEQDFDVEATLLKIDFSDLPERETFASDLWLYGRTPRFKWEAASGEVEVVKGIVQSAADPLLIGRPFRELLSFGEKN